MLANTAALPERAHEGVTARTQWVRAGSRQAEEAKRLFWCAYGVHAPGLIETKPRAALFPSWEEGDEIDFEGDEELMLLTTLWYEGQLVGMRSLEDCGDGCWTTFAAGPSLGRELHWALLAQCREIAPSDRIEADLSPGAARRWAREGLSVKLCELGTGLGEWEGTAAELLAEAAA